MDPADDVEKLKIFKNSSGSLNLQLGKHIAKTVKQNKKMILYFDGSESLGDLILIDYYIQGGGIKLSAQ